MKSYIISRENLKADKLTYKIKVDESVSTIFDHDKCLISALKKLTV